MLAESRALIKTFVFHLYDTSKLGPGNENVRGQITSFSDPLHAVRLDKLPNDNDRKC